MHAGLLILGANTAGLSAALEARRRDSRLEITVLEASHAASWSNCDLPYNLGDPQRQAEDLLLRDPAFFAERGIRILFQHRVARLDASARTVEGLRERSHPFSLNYDRLVIASGARPRRLDSLPEGVPALRSIEELRQLKQALARSTRIALIGAGSVALEVVDALAGSGRKILLLEQGARPLSDWPSFVGDAFANALATAGCDYRPRTALREARRTAEGWLLHTSDGDTQRSGALVHCAGILPATDFLPSGVLRQDERGALVVNDEQATSLPGIWAAGDCCCRVLPRGEGLLWNPQALDARRAGRVAGANAAADAGLKTPLPQATMILKALGLEAARCGRFDSPLEMKDGLWSERPPESKVAREGSGLLGAQLPAVSAPSPAGASGRLAWQGNYPLSGHVGDTRRLRLRLEARQDGQLRGGALLCQGEGALRINALVALLGAGLGLQELEALDLAYTPRLGPAVDPLIQAARRLLRELQAGQGNSAGKDTQE